MKSFTKAMEVSSRLMCAVAVAALVAMMVLTLADVVLRAFGWPIPGTYELVGILGAVIIGFSIPYTTMARGHVIMDFLTESLSRPVRSGAPRAHQDTRYRFFRHCGLEFMPAGA